MSPSREKEGDGMAIEVEGTMALNPVLDCESMMNGFSPDSFYDRVSYMVNAVSGSDISRPVACITLYPHFRDFEQCHAWLCLLLQLA